MVLAQIVAVACFLTAGIAWMVALVSAVSMSRRAESGRGLGWLVTSGHAFFSGKGFSPAAKPYRRRFLGAAVVFFVSILVGAVVIALFLSQ